MQPFLSCRPVFAAAFTRTVKTVVVGLAIVAVFLFLPPPAAKDALASQSALLSGNLIISPGLLSVLNMPEKSSTTTVSISFQLVSRARATIEIRNEIGTLVKELLTPTEFEAGPHGFTWDGKDASGAPVPEGAYLVTLRVYGINGGFEEKTGKLTVRTARSLELNGYKSFQYRGAFIDGNASAFAGGPPGSSLEQALALEAEGYATPQIYVRGSYDDTAGPSLRQFMVAYEGEKVQASAGDLTVGYPEQEFTLRERSVFGGQVGGSLGNNRLDLILARVDSTSTLLRCKGDGLTTAYWLNAPVIPGSERVSVHNRQLTRDVDYVIDYGSGELALWRPVPYDEELVVAYEYLPGHKFYRQDLFGVRSRTRVSEEIGFAFNAVRLGDELTPVDQGATASQALPPPGQLWNYDLNGQTRLWDGGLILAGEWAKSLYNRDWRSAKWFAAPGEPGTAYKLQMNLVRGKLNLDGNLRRVNQDFRPIAAGDLQTGVDALSLGGEYQAWPFLSFVSQYSARAAFPVAEPGQSTTDAMGTTGTTGTTSITGIKGTTVTYAVGSRLKLAGVSRMPANFPEIGVNLTRSLRSPQSLPLPDLLANPFPSLASGEQPSSPFDTLEEGVGLDVHQSTSKLAYAMNLARTVETSLITTDSAADLTANPAADSLAGSATKWSASLATQFQPVESLVITSKFATQRKSGIAAAASLPAINQANGTGVPAELVRREDIDLAVKFASDPGLSTTAGVETFLLDDREAGLNNRWTAARLGVEKALSGSLYAGLEGSQQKRWSHQEKTTTIGAASTDGLSNEIKGSLRYARLAKLSGAIRQKTDTTWTETSPGAKSKASLGHDLTMEYSPRPGTSIALERHDSQDQPESNQPPGGQISWILRGSAQARPGLAVKTSVETTAQNYAAQTQVDRNFTLGITCSAGPGVQLSTEYKWSNRTDFLQPEKGYAANVITLGVMISF